MECRPSCSDPAFDFQCLLLVERDSLTQIFHAFVLCQYFDAHFTDYSFRVGNGNFENSKLFEGLVILKKNTQPHITQRISLDFLLSFLSSCLRIFLVFHLVFRVVSRLSSPLLSLFLSTLSVCLSPCVVVCVCGVWWCLVCGVARRKNLRV